ncbi:MAG: hypothetical protein NW237_13030 [Cyanobacteriota bacterium]|nr:hypothetical protein [Cyanobacteriota bacterium]
MNTEEAVVFLDEVLEKDKRLNDLQVSVFSYAWEGKTYAEIAKVMGYGADHIKHVGSDLWALLSELTGEKVSKANFRSALMRYRRQHSLDPIRLNHHPPHADWSQLIDTPES